MPPAPTADLSATGATQFKEMEYMTRLGLWGPGRPFANMAQVQAMITKSPGSMEMLAVSLKADGAYLARSLGLNGVDVTTQALEPTREQLKAYNTLASFWRQVLEGIHVCNTPKLEGSIGAVQRRKLTRHMARTFDQLLIAFKAPLIKAVARKALGEGKSVVICLFSTGEASARRAAGAKRKAATDHITSTVHELCTGVVDELRDSGLADLADRVEATLSHANLPPACLDDLVNDFGVDNVAEMSGRIGRLVGTPATGYTLQKRAAKAADVDSLNIAERKAFQSGTKRVAIITDAGATGVSLHADKREANQQRRVHICAELGWSAARVIQSFGRTHRTNQVCAPEYVILTTACAAEQRVVSTLSKRLEGLGALTKGNRKAGASERGLWTLAASGIPPLTHEEVKGFVADLTGSSGWTTSTRNWLDGLEARHGTVQLRAAFDSVATVDAFLTAALVVPLEEQAKLVDLLMGQAGTDAGAGSGAVAMRKLSSKSACVASKSTLWSAPSGAKVEALEVLTDVSLSFDEADAHRQRALARGQQAAFLVHRGTKLISLGVLKTSVAAPRVRLMLPSNQTAYTVTLQAVRSGYSVLDVDKDPSLRPAVVRIWGQQLQAAKASGLHERRFHLVHGAVFQCWPRLASCLGNDLAIKLVHTPEGVNIGGLLVPPAMAVEDLKYGLAMSDAAFSLPSTLIWKSVSGLHKTAWWTPKLITFLSRKAVLKMLDTMTDAHGTLVSDANRLHAGDRILGVFPLAAEFGPLQSSLAHLFLGSSKAGMVNAQRLASFYQFINGCGGDMVLHWLPIVAHATVATNSLFIPLATGTSAHRPHGVHPDLCSLRGLLTQMTEAEWIPERVAQLKERDMRTPCQWTCPHGHLNGLSNPRREGAECSHVCSGGGQCTLPFSYAAIARDDFYARHRQMAKAPCVGVLVARRSLLGLGEDDGSVAARETHTGEPLAFHGKDGQDDGDTDNDCSYDAEGGWDDEWWASFANGS